MTSVGGPLVDRQDALRAYAELWSGPRRVLGVEGTSGVGKSTLVRDDAGGRGRRPARGGGRVGR